MLNIIEIRLYEAFHKIAKGKAVDDLGSRLNAWYESESGFTSGQKSRSFPTVLSIAINENKCLQGEEVPQSYFKARARHQETLRKLLSF